MNGERTPSPSGDEKPDEAGERGPTIRPSLPQEDVDDRENVGTVRPQDYSEPALAGVDPVLNRTRASASGEVHGSGSGAGGGGTPEDHDDDPQGGGGSLAQNTSQAAPDTKADAPIGNTR